MYPKNVVWITPVLLWLFAFIPSTTAEDQNPTTLPVRFSEHLIADGYAYPYGVGAADIDGDGDVDLTSADYQPHNNLYLYENDGHGRFRRHFIQKGDGRRLERHRNADVDGDGDLDVVIVKNLYGHILWFENTGQPSNGELWPRHVLTTNLPGAYNVDLADFDRDGDLDVAASSWRLGNQFAWFENDGTPADNEWKKYFIEKSLPETRGLRVADFDSDGDVDVYGTAPSAGQVIWYENSGRPALDGWTKHVVDQAPRPMHGSPVDIDGDGDVDIVQALGMNWPQPDSISHHIVWYENDEETRSGPWKRHLITDQFPDAFEVAAEDLDGDGDVDVAATSWRQPGRVAWFENPGNPSTRWSTHVLKNNWRSANNIIIADLNGDHRPDIVANAEHTSCELRWWRNEGRTPAPPVDVARAAANVRRTVGHRGANAVRPSNTLASIRHGILSGATTIEVDVRMSKDGVPILRHDRTLDASTDTSGAVSDKTLAELQAVDAGSWFDPKYANERIPTLREALEVCRDRAEILLDLKVANDAFHRAVAFEVRTHGDPSQTILGVRTIEQARALRKLLKRSRQLGLIPGPEALEDFVTAGVQSVRLRKRSLQSPTVVALLERSKVELLVNGSTGTREKILTLLHFEPEAISSDHPARLIATLREIQGEIEPPVSVKPSPPSPVDLRAARRKAAHRKRRIIMNNDGTEGVSKEVEEPRTRENFLGKRTTPLVGSHVDTISYCTGHFDYYSHLSRLTELRKKGGRGDEDWAWELGTHGPDPLWSMINFAHRHDIELFWSMRMNDTHDSKYEAAMGKWKAQHPEYLVGQKGKRYPYGRCRWQGRWSSLNYEVPEVRERVFQILRDVARRYDVDGLELDFFRHPVYFKPQMYGEPVTQEHRDLMTRLLRRVREMTENQSVWRGRPLLIAVRIPDSIGYSKALGLDIVRWLEEDLVDIVTGGGYFQLEPWENLAALGKRFDVPVYACLSASRLGSPSSQADHSTERRAVGIEGWRGEASRAWEAGVNGIYLFNCFDPNDRIFRELGDPGVLHNLEKTYRPKPGRIDHWIKGGEAFIKLPE